MSPAEPGLSSLLEAAGKHISFRPDLQSSAMVERPLPLQIGDSVAAAKRLKVGPPFVAEQHGLEQVERKITCMSSC